jgi:hypothetical protein
LVHSKVDVFLTATAVSVFAKGERVASHMRSFTPAAHTTVAEHMPPAHQAMARRTPDRLRQDPALAPTYCCNAETCDGVPLHQYDFVLADPPYSTSDAERYGHCMVNRNKVMQTLSGGLPAGAFIVWLDQVLPMYRKAEPKIEAVIGIVGSTNHRFRVLTVFRRL